MSIVGFNFTKINAERKNAVMGGVNISNNIMLKDVQETKLGLGDRGAIRISFTFTSTFEPDLAKLLFEGEVVVLIAADQSTKIMDQWKKANQLPRDMAEPVMNHILDRCNIQALLLCKDLNLPSPVPLPKVRVDAPTPSEEKQDVKTTKVESKKDDKKKK